MREPGARRPTTTRSAFFGRRSTSATAIIPSSTTRPAVSAALALVISDLDLVNGIVSVNKARVAGIDRYKTKTGEDRRIELCPRALSVLKRQLRLRAGLEAAGKIDHDHVFFQETGERFWNLQYPGIRWRKTRQSLKLRYRRPYTTRHSSVSWNLMIGKNPLWVAKQHGHSIATMLRVYATWAEGAIESDIESIKRSMSRPPARRASPTRRFGRWQPSRREREISPPGQDLAVDLSLAAHAASQVTERKGKVLAEREGFESEPLSNQQLADSENDFVPDDPLKPP